jgi:hypothetical protein
VGKLNQIIAIEKGIKSRSYSEVGEQHKLLKKPELFNGFQKDYHPLAEDEAERLPSERKHVQYQVTQVLNAIRRSTVELFDITARKDWTNTLAKADVTVNGRLLIADAPVPYLLFLEKQLTDLRTIVADIPTLDEGEQWSFDQNSGLSKTAPISTHRTKKVQRPIVLYDATKEHPAQTQLIT